MNFPNIKLYRQAHNFSQNDIAEKLKINVMTYNRRERGEREFTASNIVELSILFKCTTDDLLLKKFEIVSKKENEKNNLSIETLEHMLLKDK